MGVLVNFIASDSDVIVDSFREVMIACCGGYRIIAAFNIDSPGRVQADDPGFRVERCAVPRRRAAGGDCMCAAVF